MKVKKYTTTRTSSSSMSEKKVNETKLEITIFSPKRTLLTTRGFSKTSI
jgi:hypothetical protein